MSNFDATDLANLDAAIAQNVLEVQFADGRRVTFSSWEELIKRRNYVAQQLGEDQGRQRMLAKYKKGLSG